MNGHVERRVSKTKGIRYRAMLFVDAEHGGPRWQTLGTFDREGAANAKLVKVLDAYHGGTYRRPSRITVAELLDAWLTQHVAQLRPLSRQNYGSICANFIVPELGAELAESVTPADVSAWLARLLKDGRRDGRGGMSPKYVRQVRMVLRAAYSWSLRHGEISSNPVDAAPGPAVKQRPCDPPTLTQMQAAAEALAGTRYYVPMLIAAATAMRRGEVLGLSWQHVDLTQSTVRVRRQLIETAAGVAFNAPKTEEARRDLFLPPFLAAVLQGEMERQQVKAQMAGYAWSADALVCPNHDGGPIPPDQFSRGFTAMLRRRGLPTFRFHDLRHAVATEMLEAGERADVVQRQLGHASVAITLGVYAHVRAGETEKAAARYGRRWQPSEPQGEPDDGASAATRNQSDLKSGDVLDMAEARSRKRPA